MRSLVRDLLRQRWRTGLTVLGVALGIFTLVVLGAMGEHFRIMIEEAKVYTRGQVRLFTKTNAEGINPGITEDVLTRIRALPAVQVVAPTHVIFFDGFDLEDDPLMFMMPKPLVEGLPAADAEVLRSQGIQLLEGRWLREGDTRHAMIVDWLAQRRDLAVGDEVVIRHKAHEVVGIYHAPDVPMVPAGIVPYDLLNEDHLLPEIERAQVFFRSLASHPLARGLGLGAEADPKALDRLARAFALQQGSMFRVYEIVPHDRSREGTRALATRLREIVPNLAVIDPERIEERMEQAIAIFLVITLVVTVISTIVSGLLIVNTMAMAVIERRREIAIKVSMGATPGQVALEFVFEAALLATLGAALGVLLGALAIFLCEPWLLGMLETGASLFKITPRLVAFAIGYAVVMGVLAGGIPALRASRIDPAITLREL